MKKSSTIAFWPLTVAALTALAAGASAPPAQRGLVKVRGGEASQVPDAFDQATWRAALTDPDLDQREQSYERLLREARRSRAVPQALRQWAQDTTQPELAWTSRLALAELERSSSPFGRRRSLGEVIEEDDPFGFPTFLDDIERRLEELRARSLQPPGSLWQVPQGGGGSAQAESFKMESGPDGVRVEIQTDVNGEETTQTFEADSLEELLAANPELEGRIGAAELHWGSVGPGWLMDLDSVLGRVREMAGHAGDDGVQGDPQSVRTDVLGVLMREPGDWSVSVEGLEPGVGLLVERIFRDTIAQVLGVRRGDVLVELNGTPLRSGDDVQRTLAARPADAEVRLVLIDRTGQRRERVWKPSVER